MMRKMSSSLTNDEFRVYFEKEDLVIEWADDHPLADVFSKYTEDEWYDLIKKSIVEMATKTNGE